MALDHKTRDSTKSAAYLGVDPGVGGGLALLVSHPSGRVGVRTARMPVTDTDIVTVLMAWQDEVLGEAPLLACLEQIRPGFPGTGKSSMSKLYGSYRGLRMALTACRIPFEEVRASCWQSALAIPKRGKTETDALWKGRLRMKAQQLFPFVVASRHTADAILIAEYARRRREHPRPDAGRGKEAGHAPVQST